ncbi:hypothetical protein ACHAWF_002068 [Thalassiosira exigua]
MRWLVDVLKLDRTEEGVDGRSAIVQLQFTQNVVAHLHRMGCRGRACNCDGRGVVFYSVQQRKFLELVREAEEQQARMTLVQDMEDGGELGDGAEVGKMEKAFGWMRGFLGVCGEKEEAAEVRGRAGN